MSLYTSAVGGKRTRRSWAVASRDDLRQAVAFTFDGRGRLWVVEKNAGVIRVIDPAHGGAGRRFFRVSNVVGNTEQGLVGIALHPKFPTGSIRLCVRDPFDPRAPCDQISHPLGVWIGSEDEGAGLSLVRVQHTCTVADGSFSAQTACSMQYSVTLPLRRQSQSPNSL